MHQTWPSVDGFPPLRPEPETGFLMPMPKVKGLVRLLKANQLIAGLPRENQDVLLARGEIVKLAFGDSLCKRRDRYVHTYFPLTGFISLTASVAGHAPMEVGMIGNEGMLGASMVLGGSEVPQDALVQGDGTALMLSAADTRALLATAPAFVRALNGYLFVLTLQLAQSVACTRFHVVEARLARWLLMTHDRMHKDRFYLTHQFLADMLGVQRSAVTIASVVLKDAGIIDYSRGEIRIIKRKELERLACECYPAPVPLI